MSDTLTMTEQEILDQIQREVAENRVFVFMKGTPEMPRCGFSNQVVQILNHLNVEYGARDVLTDPRIREVLSGWSQWPTIPQVFVDGELIGGCDITTELFQNGELQKLVGSEAARRHDAGSLRDDVVVMALERNEAPPVTP